MHGIQGEYWITESGETMFADGDVGDDNHETRVLSHARLLLMDALNLATPEDMADVRSWMANLGKALGLDADLASDREWRDAIHRCAEGVGADPEECHRLFAVAQDTPESNPREFAMREWGWVWVNGHDVACWTLDRETVGRIRRGLVRLLDEEGVDEPGAESELEFVVRVGASDKRLRTTIEGLRTERPRVEPGAYDLGFAALRMAERMDREMMSPCYRGAIGD